MTQELAIRNDNDNGSDSTPKRELPRITLRTLGEAYAFVRATVGASHDPEVRQQAEAIEAFLRPTLAHYGNTHPIDFGKLINHADLAYDLVMRAHDEDHERALEQLAKPMSTESVALTRDELTNREHYVSMRSVQIVCGAIAAAPDPATCAKAVQQACRLALHELTHDDKHPSEPAAGRSLSRLVDSTSNFGNIPSHEMARVEEMLDAMGIA